LSKFLEGFSCHKNQDVQDFLRKKAIRFDSTHNSRTYLIFDEEQLNFGIFCYFTLSFKEIILEDDYQISKSKIKKLNGISKNAERIRAFLIGQLGKNTSIKNNPLNLKEILSEVFSILQQAQELIGGRVILLECEDNEKLINLYRNNGFEVLQKSDLVQMYLIFDISKRRWVEQ
jgi:hypothetical protein